MISLLLLSFFGFAPSARAGVLFDFDATSFQDNQKTSSTNNESKLFYSAGLYVDVDKKGRYYLGASFAGLTTQAQETSGTTQFSAQDLILGFRWIANRDRTMMVSGGYGYLSRATLREPSVTSNQNLTGTSLYFKFTIAPEVLRDFHVGLSLIYYQSVYSQLVNSGTSSTVNYNKSLIFPSIGATYRF